MMKYRFVWIIGIVSFFSCQKDSDQAVTQNEHYPIVTEVFRDGKPFYKNTYLSNGRVERTDYYQTGHQSQHAEFVYSDRTLEYERRLYTNDTLFIITWAGTIENNKQLFTNIRYDGGNPVDTTITERVYFDDLNCGIHQEWSVFDGGVACLWRENELIDGCNSARYRLPCQAGQPDKYLSNLYEYDDKKNGYGSFYGSSRGHLKKYIALTSQGDTLMNRSYQSTIEYLSNDYPTREIRNYFNGKIENYEFKY